MKLTVTRQAMRPASRTEACFYCGEPVGGTHQDDCVLIKKRVRVRLTLECEYDVSVPSTWTERDVEFHRNNGSWCASNLIGEIQEAMSEGGEGEGCLCNVARFQYVETTSIPFLEEDDGSPASDLGLVIGSTKVG